MGDVVTVLAALATLVGVVSVAAHYRTPGSIYTLCLAAFSPWFALGAVIGAGLFAVEGGAVGWTGLVVSLAVLAWAVGVRAPLYRAAEPGSGPIVTAMTCNLLLGRADAAAVVRAVRAHQVDVLMLQELTDEAKHALGAGGLDSELPFHCADPRDGGAGAGLWSRFPLDDTEISRKLRFSLVRARVQTPGGTVGAVALHLAGPAPNWQFPGWRHDMERLPGVLDDLPENEPVLVGGDFNATLDVAQLRRLVIGGYSDAAEQAGVGITRSYPAHLRVPPLIAIDHVLTRGAVATQVRTVTIAGSDHCAVVATLVLDS